MRKSNEFGACQQAGPKLKVRFSEKYGKKSLYCKICDLYYFNNSFYL